MPGENKTENKSAQNSIGKNSDRSVFTQILPIDGQNIPADTQKGTHRMTIRPLKTYRGDAEEAIQRQKESLASIALREQKKRAAEKESETPPTISPENQKRIMVIAAIVVGLIAAGGGIFTLVRYGNFSFTSTPPGETVVVKINSSTPFIIVPRYEREVDSTANNSKNTLADTVADEAGKTPESGSITNIALTQVRMQGLPDLVAGKSNLPAGVFLSTYFTNAPDVLVRALDDNFMLGIYYDTAQKGHAFLIFKTNSFEASFAGMLSWEKTLLQNLGFLIGSKEGTGRFKDVVMQNKDTRALLDRAQEPVFIYSFVDRNTLLVAPDKETFGNILDILNQPKRVTQ
ncbi:MAG: hypothetical protein Q7S11_03600 [bacterium]|nr:hypothetical protein [bacterium]